MTLLEAVDPSVSQEEAIPEEVAETILDKIFKGFNETGPAPGISYS